MANAVIPSEDILVLAFDEMLLGSESDGFLSSVFGNANRNY